MKLALLALGISTTFACSAQNGTTIESLSGDVLYRGYMNKVTIVVDKNEDRKTHLNGRNASMTHDTEPNTYIVKPMNGTTTTLYALAMEGSKVVDTLCSKIYIVNNLPVPDLYWGDQKSGGTADLSAKILSLRYPEEVSLPNDFKIVKWEIALDDEILKGFGNDVSSVESVLKQVQTGTVLKIVVTVQCADGISRMIYGNWGA